MGQFHSKKFKWLVKRQFLMPNNYSMELSQTYNNDINAITSKPMHPLGLSNEFMSSQCAILNDGADSTPHNHLEQNVIRI